MSDRRDLLRRAGAGAAGVSLAQLLGPAAALAGGGGGGGDFPDHPRWRFVFVSHNTLDPLLVATQFGAQDAAALVNCSVQWTGSPRGSADETARALRSAVSRKADGIAVSIVEDLAFVPGIEAARQAKIPLVAFNVGHSNGRQVRYTGEDPLASGLRAGAELARLVPSGKVLVLAPENARKWTSQRQSGVVSGLALAKGRSSILVRLADDLPRQEHEVEAALAAHPAARGAVALDRAGTVALGAAIERTGRRIHGGGFDLLPDDLKLIADGHLGFAVDQQPYVQGFSPVVQLFLARISQGTVKPWDTETSILLRKADVKAFIDTKSRFEGSSSRHEYPLRRA
jgi:simple sugar transport system substrate-binding protein